jgi:uncharacterized membrane protein
MSPLPGLTALALASVFVGAALYVNLVEQPSRLALDDRAMVSEWKPSDRRGFAMLATLAVIAAIAGLLAFRQSGDVRWLVGAIVIMASWPYTFFVVVPVNNRLLAMSEQTSEDNARVLVRDWGLLEWGQTALGLWAAGTFLWALM